MLVDVALPLPILRTFTYAVPAELRAGIGPGARVLVPFRRGERIGWVDRVRGDGGANEKIRALHGVLGPEPPVTPPLLELCRWIAEYYVAPLGLVLRSALPAALSDSSSDWIALPDGAAAELDVASLSPLEQDVLEWLRRKGEAQPLARLRRERGDRAWWPAIRRLESAGQLEVRTAAPRTQPPLRTRRVVRLIADLPSLRERERVFARAKRQRECFEAIESLAGIAELAHLTGPLGFSDSVPRALVEKGFARFEDAELPRDPYAEQRFEQVPRQTPTREQAAALEALIADARTASPATWVLRGVTGSGKTLVYIELLREVVDVQRRTAIVLVPEIALTPQTVGRFKTVFGDRVAVLHSALSDGERYDEWRALRSGEKRIVVGARSAIFAPLPDLGAIVVDEEHEATYKQSEAPRYHAREVAVVRARLGGAVCVLGSATPALETWHNVGSEKYRLLVLPSRIADRPLPAIRVVDLRAERKREAATTGPLQDRSPTVLSMPLADALHARLERGEQSILLLNRRGYSTFVQCRACGHVWYCPACNVSLTFHRRRARLVCHHCFHSEDRPERCSACGSDDLGFRGVGTEQVERSVGETFASARIARMDVDTTSGKWAHHRILERVERGEVDILLGTQMIAKGLDFPNVTLVGVINADVGINLPDFRATERTFQLLTQVAGRAGRGPKGGEVIIQTSLPEHYAVVCATNHDYDGFAARELESRREPSYPPFSRLVNVVFSATEEAPTQEAAEQAATWIEGLLEERGVRGVEVIGPAPCPIDRIRGRWRWHLLLRSPGATLLGQIARYFASRFTPAAAPQDLRIALDRDPVALL